MSSGIKVDDLTETSAIKVADSSLKLAGEPRNRSKTAERKVRIDRGIIRLGEFDIFSIRAGYDRRGESIALAIIRQIASKYHLDLFDLYEVTLDDLAQWVGDKGHDRRKDTRREMTVIEKRLAAIRDHSGNMVSKFAKNNAKHMPTGRGTRPKLTYHRDMETTADNMRVNGETMTDGERYLWLKESRYQRAESDIYSPWITSLGDIADGIGADSPHAYGGVPAGLPEREAAGLRHSDIMDRLQVADIPDKDRQLVIDSLANIRTSQRKITDENGEPTKEYRHNVEWIKVRNAAKARGDKRGQKAIKAAVTRVLEAIDNLRVNTDRLACNDASYPITSRHKQPDYGYVNAVIEPNLPIKVKAKLAYIVNTIGTKSMYSCEHQEDCPQDCPLKLQRKARINALDRLDRKVDMPQARLSYLMEIDRIGGPLV